MDARERRDRAGGAEQVEAAAAGFAAGAGGELMQGGGDMGDHGLENSAVDGAAAELLGQGHDAQAQRRPLPDTRAHAALRVGWVRAARGAGPLAVQPDDLRGAAPDIEEHHALRRGIGKGGATGGGEPRFGLAVDDFEPQTRPLGHPLDEGGAVGGGAARLRGDQPGAADPPRRELVAADGQRIQGAQDRRFAEFARLDEPLAEPDDAREGIDDPKAVLRRSGDEQAAIVRAEIEGGIGSFGTTGRPVLEGRAAASIALAVCSGPSSHADRPRWLSTQAVTPGEL